MVVLREEDEDFFFFSYFPVYKSELKSGPVRNPGTVPFLWEQIPGRPKGESKSETPGLERPPTTPKLPPGRVSNTTKQASDKGSIPKAAAQSPTGNAISNSQNVLTFDRKVVTKYESSTEGREDNGIIAASEDGDETYLDARDALSRSESFYMNCSISGLSGLDGIDIKPSGTFSTDPETRDFMMGRFLPAAKAMASETPQHASRKQQVPREKPVCQEQPKKAASGDKQYPVNQHRPHYGQDIAVDKTEEGMGLRSISSVRSVRVKSSYASSYREAKNEHPRGDACEQRLMKGHQEARVREDKNDSRCESNPITNKSDCQKSDKLPVYKRQQGRDISPYRNEYFHHEEKGFLGIPEQAKNSRKTRSSGKYRKGQNFQELLATENIAQRETDQGSPVVEKTLYIDSVHTVKSPNSNSHSSDTKALVVIDYRRNAFEIAEKRNEVEETHSLQSSFQDIEHLGGGNEKAIVRHESLEYPDSTFLSCSGRSNEDVQTDKKNGSTLEQDLIQDLSKMTSSKVADQEKSNLKSQQLGKSGDREHYCGLSPDCTTLTRVKLADEKKIDTKSPESGTSGREKSSHGHYQNSITLTDSKVARKGKIDLSRQLVKLGNQESARGYNSQLPLGPPLPKSPSESWLKRTLPTISSRTSASQSSPGSHIYASCQAKTSSLDPKWETIVKTSNTHHGRLRFSEELLTPIPEA